MVAAKSLGSLLAILVFHNVVYMDALLLGFGMEVIVKVGTGGDI